MKMTRTEIRHALEQLDLTMTDMAKVKGMKAEGFTKAAVRGERGIRN